MVTLKFILGIIFMLISVALVILILMQRSKEEGLSGAITGQKTESFYSRSGANLSKEKFLMRLTIVLGVAFAVIAIILSALMRFGV
ncbi:MAG: preprotein translocase subunit SecG [Clostridia bacterium]|nr:preprotein translocase subunit SecG [Clostridia bacterium]